MLLLYPERQHSRIRKLVFDLRKIWVQILAWSLCEDDVKWLRARLSQTT